MSLIGTADAFLSLTAWRPGKLVRAIGGREIRSSASKQKSMCHDRPGLAGPHGHNWVHRVCLSLALHGGSRRQKEFINFTARTKLWGENASSLALASSRYLVEHIFSGFYLQALIRYFYCTSKPQYLITSSRTLFECEPSSSPMHSTALGFVGS